MGLTKQYLRYSQSAVFGVIGNSGCNVAWTGPADATSVSDASRGRQQLQLPRLVATGACENVNLWDVVTGQLAMCLRGCESEVVCVAVSCGRHLLASGHADGSVCVWSLTSGDQRVTLRGHRAPVTCLAFDSAGMRLASGSKDTEIVVWDIVSESGLFRLKGHRGAVTQLAFMQRRHSCLVSASKDALLKLWHLDSQHCFKTLSTHLTEVWDFVLYADESRLITGSGDNQLRVYSLEFLDRAAAACSTNTSTTATNSSNGSSSRDSEADGLAGSVTTDAADAENVDQCDDASFLACTRVGSVLRQGTGRLLRMAADSSGRLLACHGPDCSLELFLVLSRPEAERRRAKRVKRLRKTLSVSGETDGSTAAREADSQSVDETVTLSDELRRLPTIRTPSKLRAVDIILTDAATAKVVVLLANNSLLTYSVCLQKPQQQQQHSVPPPAAAAAVSTSCLHLPGHRSDVRALDFSTDGAILASASSEQLKLWNTESQLCVLTVGCAPALCVAVVAGDRYVLVGSSSGRLQLFQLATGQLTEDVQAHESQLWSLHVAPEGRGFATAGADKQVKFWQFEMVTAAADDDGTAAAAAGGVGGAEAGAGRQLLSFTHARSLALDDDCLCVRYSPDGRLVAVASLDSTVKVFFNDTLKLFLTLYGHRLPVTCMAISSDASLIVTGSGDKNIKLWGLDFGDCRKSFFAHDDIVTGVGFLGRSHQVFSCGKDGLLKHWDMDCHQRITTLSGHCGQITALAVSRDGKCVASAARDRSLRLWRRTDEPLVVDEERDQERARADDAQLASGPAPALPGEHDPETGRPGHKSADTERATERVMEAVEICTEAIAERARTAGSSQQQQLHPLMAAYNCHTPEQFIVDTLSRVKSSELEECLLLLPFSCALQLLRLLCHVLRQPGQCAATELVCRCVCHMLRVHHAHLVTGGSLPLPLVQQLQLAVHKQLGRMRDMMGFNMAALQFMQQELAERQQVKLFVDATVSVKARRKKRKRAEAASLQQAALLSL